MNAEMRPRFFNRNHAVQGLQTIGVVFALFAWVSLVASASGERHHAVRPLVWVGATLGCACAASILARRLGPGLYVLLAGAALASIVFWAALVLAALQPHTNHALELVAVLCGLVSAALVYLLCRLRSRWFRAV